MQENPPVALKDYQATTQTSGLVNCLAFDDKRRVFGALDQTLFMF